MEDDLDDLLDSALETLEAEEKRVEEKKQVPVQAPVPADDAPPKDAGVAAALGLGEGELPADLEAFMGRVARMLDEQAPAGDGTSPAPADGLQDERYGAMLRGLEDMARQAGAQGGEDGDLMKALMEALGGAGAGGTEGAGLEAMMESMMKELLSKDVVHQPLVELRTQFPAWLAQHRASLPSEDIARYEAQLVCIDRLVRLYEADGDHSEEIMDLMGEMQSHGQPPEDLVRALAPSADASPFSSLPDMEKAPNCPTQ